MECRPGCGACCIAPSISSPIPGMPSGKATGQRCIQLDEHNLCQLFGSTTRPTVCASFTPTRELCGQSPQQAHAILAQLEALTA